MTRPRIFTLLGCVVVPILGLTLYFHTRPVDRGFKNADLTNARTEEQIVAILGPHRDYSTKTRGYTSIGFEPVKGRSVTDRTIVWKDDYVCWEVDVNQNGGITYIYRLTVVEGPRSWLHRQIDSLLGTSAPL